MWNKILLLATIHVVLTGGHPLGGGGVGDGGPNPSAVWDVNFSELPGTPTEDELYKIYENSRSNDNDYYRPSKRAFTLLSRWRPFSHLTRNSPSIREQNRQIFNDLDIETRAMLRPVGQPLRWG